MSKRDYYETLGVQRNADKEQIKKAYRRLARQYHPDVNKEAGAAEQFKEINEAHEVLSDTEKRAAYDRYGHAAFQAGGGANYQDFAGSMADIFEEFFSGFSGSSNAGRRRAGPRRGADLRYDLEITFEEAVFGTEKTFEITRPTACTGCNGSGSEPGSTPARCTNCNGTGEVRRVQQSILGQFVNVSTCNVCGGTGEMIVHPCKTCNGRKIVQQTKPLTVKIPAGVDNNMQIRLSNEGAPGADGGPAGHLFVVIHVKEHHHFRRQGEDIYLEMNINIAQAALGDEIEVPTVDGSQKLAIPHGTQAGTKFTLYGQGVPKLQKSGRGNQYVIVHVAIPKKLTDQQRQLFEELASTLSDKAVVSQKEKGFLNSIRETLGDMFGF